MTNSLAWYYFKHIQTVATSAILLVGDSPLILFTVFNNHFFYCFPDGNRIPSVSMSKLKFEAFARELLLVRKYRLEIYCNKVKSGNNWFLAYKVIIKNYYYYCFNNGESNRSYQSFRNYCNNENLIFVCGDLCLSF